jgi:four helix bundle suffix protein
MTDGFIPAHGGYRELCSYKKAVIVYDATVRFCDRFVPRHGDRTRDQMIQAARSGKQNIVEGSQMSGTSKELELKLTNVARASLEELAEDYRDLTRVTCFLLDRQIKHLEKTFIEEGGLRERMTRARLTHRAQQREFSP